MARLTKEAVLKLRLDGFKPATQLAKRLGQALLQVTQDARRLATAGGQAGRTVAKAMTDTARSSKRVGSELKRVEGQAKQTTHQFLRMGAAAGRVGQAARRSGAQAAAAMRQASASTSEATGAAGLLHGAWGKVLVGVFAAQRAIDAVMATLSRGSEVAGVSGAFESLAGGGAQAARQLEALRGATQGAVADTNLMAGANRLALSGLELSAEQMRTTAAAAVALGRAQGISAADSYDRLTLALAKQEPELLDEIGLKVDLTKAIRDLARERGVEVSQIDAQGRSQAFANAVMEQARARAGQLGTALDQQGQPLQSLAAQWQNMLDRFSEMIARNPQIIRSIEEIGRAAITVASALAPVAELVATVAGKFSGLSIGAKVVNTVSGGQGGIAPGDRFGASAPLAVASAGPAPRALRSSFDAYGAAVEGAARESGRALNRRLQFGGL